MAKQRKARTFSPGKKPKSALPGTLKGEVDTKARELVRKSGLPASALIEVGTDHRLADPEPSGKMLEACEWRVE